MTVQRIVLGIIALLTVGWLAVSYSNSQVIRDVQSVSAASHPTPAQLEGALRDVPDAGRLDPSRGVEIKSYEASLLIRLNRIPDALRTLEEIVRLEPDYVEAWFLIEKLSPDRARAAEAAAQVRRLNPPVRRKQR
jgi:hypothetical protein